MKWIEDLIKEGLFERKVPLEITEEDCEVLLQGKSIVKKNNKLNIKIALKDVDKGVILDNIVTVDLGYGEME